MLEVPDVEHGYNKFDVGIMPYTVNRVEATRLAERIFLRCPLWSPRLSASGRDE